MFDKMELKEKLREKVAEVTFTKADGTERKMVCTLMDEYLPEISPRPLEEARKENDSVLAVWDLEKEAWRSFRLDSVTNVLYMTQVEKA